jgi:hypothetical protein
MIFRLAGFLDRYRRALAGTGLVLTVAEIAVAPAVPMLAYAAIAVVGAASAATGLGLTWAVRNRPVTGLPADPRARTLATPRTGVEVLWSLTGLQALALFSGHTATVALDGQLSLLGLLGVLLFAGMLAVSARGVARGVGVTLRPDGIQADKLTGAMFVPWEALAPGQPDPGTQPRELTLAYARPELVRTTGIVPAPADLEFAGVDPAFLAAAIRSYVHHPETRHAIGTEADQERLQDEPGRGGYGLRPMPGPPAMRTMVIQGLTGALLLVGAITLRTGLDPVHSQWSLFAVLPAWTGVQYLRRARAGWKRR